MLFRFFFFFMFIFILKASAFDSQNNRPIIGIVTVELNSTVVPSAKSHLVSSYVKFIEAAGGRVVPIWIWKPKSYYEDIMSKINGVLFPGGDDLLEDDGYGRTGQLIIEIATKINDDGDFFPLWGTCLGFQLLQHALDEELLMEACDAQNLALNIQFTTDFKHSKLFENLETSLENKMKNQRVAFHFHGLCISPQSYSLSVLDKYFKILALNQDERNNTFVSIIEAYKYPFYGVAFHPEKIIFEWAIHLQIPHNLDAIQVSHYFANFFVNEARKSFHRFPTKEEEDTALIYNYNPVFTGLCETDQNTQTYFFMN